jgi:hypothetical protein
MIIDVIDAIWILVDANAINVINVRWTLVDVVVMVTIMIVRIVQRLIGLNMF